MQSIFFSHNFHVRKEYCSHPSEKKNEKWNRVGISNIASSFAINPTYVGISTNFEFSFRYNEFRFDQINFIAIWYLTLMEINLARSRFCPSEVVCQLRFFWVKYRFVLAERAHNSQLDTSGEWSNACGWFRMSRQAFGGHMCGALEWIVGWIQCQRFGCGEMWEGGGREVFGCGLRAPLFLLN